MIIWEGASRQDGSPIVGIVTGIDSPSSNRKTGPMAQLWILRADMPPLEALRTDADAAICGDCPLRGVLDRDTGSRVGRVCYVNVGQAPTSVYRAYERGSYPRVTPDHVSSVLAHRGVSIRLGAYGDPAMLPLSVITALCNGVKGTGYTHQWRHLDRAWAAYLMASADTVSDRRDARRAGWRSFYVVPMDTDLATVPHAVECMATRERNRLTCAQCLACSGTKGRDTVAVDVVIRAHGTGGRYVTA